MREREKEAATHHEKGWRESGDVTGAIEWKTEMLMRWSGRTSERTSGSETASDHSRKQEGENSREERDKRARYKLHATERRAKDNDEATRKIERVHGGK